MLDFDLIILGGGPSGMAAASQAAIFGLSVALIDERPSLGGQIYKRLSVGFQVFDSAALGHDYAFGDRLINETIKENICVFLSTTLVTIEDDYVVVVTHGESAKKLSFKKLLLTPGAYDRPVVFPGWTLPGVITAGAAQSLVKTQRVFPGKRILFAGSGPLALAFPAQLVNYGANIVETLEASSPPNFKNLFRLTLASPGNFNLLKDALFYRWLLFKNRVPMRYNRIVVRANGTKRLESVTHARVDKNWRPIKGTEETIVVDTICIGYGFLPSVELFKLVGCDFTYDENLGGPVLNTDEWGATTILNIFGAGDGTGVAGSYLAISRGRLAAIKIASELGFISDIDLKKEAKKYQIETRRRAKFQQALNKMFIIGLGIFELANDETIICRCEVIKKSDLEVALRASSDLSVIKSYTRCGMGLCQGRYCQREIAALISQKYGIPISEVPQSTPRFPAKPISLGEIADATVHGEKYYIDAE